MEDLKIMPDESLSKGPSNAKILFELALKYASQYMSTCREADLTKAIGYYITGLEHQPLDQVKDTLLLKCIAMLLQTRFKQLGDLKDLEVAVACYRQILNICVTGDPSLYSSLGDLGNTLQDRFKQLGNIRDLQEAIFCHQQALNLCLPSHLDCFKCLHNLAHALWTRFQQLGEMTDLDKAIVCNQQALELCPSGNPDQLTSLNHLAHAVWARFEKQREIRDLEEAIIYYQAALDLCPHGHPDHSISLSNVANALHVRFEQLGEMKDLEEAVACYYQALDLHPPGHPRRSNSLNSLAIALQSRFKQLGDMMDLDEALAHHHQALSLRPPGHSSRSTSLNNLAITLVVRFKQLGDTKDLEAALNCHQQALNLRAVGHPYRSSSLSNIANAWELRFKTLGEAHDLEEAISCHYQALDLCPPGHNDHPMCLNNLANALQTQFEHLGNIQHLFLATKHYKAALLSLPPNHPFCGTVMTAQAQQQIALHQSPWISCQDCSHCDNACRLLEEAANHLTSSIYQRFKAARKWANTAHKYDHTSAITAYTKALLLQQECLILLPSVKTQQKLMTKSATLGLDAASCAIKCGSFNTAVEFLEQGRAIIWSKLHGYRQSIQKISQQNPELACEFKALSNQLESFARHQNGKNTEAISDGQIELQRTLSKKWNKLHEKIRQVDGFSDFMEAVPFKALEIVVEQGPVIMINISDFQSDAMILLSSNSMTPSTVPLPDVTPEILKCWVKKVKSVTTGISPSSHMIPVLQALWDTIVQPVTAQLLNLGVVEKSHIWWCPTSHLCALPLHAAGPYKKGQKNLPDMYISSYTPTLLSLIKARSGALETHETPSVLLVGQHDGTIPKVLQETEIIKGFRMQVECCSGEDAHKQAVLTGLKNNNWAHFACHGHLEDQPFHSGFQLHNKEHLTVLDLTQAQLPNAEFAFLSACHSAAGGTHGTPDEAIHLAAGLQFSGFKSVIGTLWAMVDDDGPTIAEIFYQHMFRNPNSVTLRDAAEALNLATRYLRKKGVPLERWVNFVHIGA